LDSVCGADTDLRAEVERLLAGNLEPSWQSPAAELFAGAAEIAPGDTVAHYRIEAKLGEGGMFDIHVKFRVVDFLEFALEGAVIPDLLDVPLLAHSGVREHGNVLHGLDVLLVFPDRYVDAAVPKPAQ
jgi:hypothetical protein